MSEFLTPEDLRILTGKAYKSKQVKELLRMGIPFWINAAGKPVVSKAAIGGDRFQQPVKKLAWEPAVLHRAA